LIYFKYFQNEPKNIKIKLHFLSIMSEERFKKYIQELEPGTTCSVFLKKQEKFIANVIADSETKKEFKIHKALSKLKRYLMYKLLQEKPMCTCALARVFQISEGTVTHHLKILQEAGLIMGKKEGYFTRYYPVEKLIQLFT